MIHWSILANIPNTGETDMKKVLSNEHPNYAPIVVEFTCKQTSYRATLDLQITPALASVSCGKCGESTRDIFKKNGVSVDDDDAKVDVTGIIARLPADETSSMEDPDFVSVITDVTTRDIMDTSSMIPIADSSPTFKKIDKYIEKILLNKILCGDCCFEIDYLGSLLNC